MTAPHPAWQQILHPVSQTSAFQQMLHRIQSRQEAGVTVYPPQEVRYSALSLAPEDIKVVVVGQDPYHGPGQAHGWSFSVPDGVTPPPSLRNIFKEVENQGYQPAQGRTGNLAAWHAAGVCLLNTVLTVERGSPGSHQGWGWEPFTAAILRHLAGRPSGCVFLLWGKQAQAHHQLVSSHANLVLQSAHPSPYSAHQGFFGNGHFRKANDWLEAKGSPPIPW